MRVGKDVGSSDAVGDGVVLFTIGDTLVLASPAGAADVAALNQLAKVLPKATGSTGVAPLLPSFVSAQHLVPSGLRYALGPESYAAEGECLGMGQERRSSDGQLRRETWARDSDHADLSDPSDRAGV